MLVSIRELYAELFGSDTTVSEQMATDLSAQLAQQERNYWVHLATNSSHEPLGLYTLAESFAVFAGGAYGVLNELWVHPTARGRGIGGRLLDHCAAFARARGWGRVDVTAPADARWDPSYAFYQKHGFVPSGRKLKLLL
jgi:GNAT superfamily N-acetyltransferase